MVQAKQLGRCPVHTRIYLMLAVMLLLVVELMPVVG